MMESNKVHHLKTEELDAEIKKNELKNKEKKIQTESEQLEILADMIVYILLKEL